jgi:acetolactate synthase-1/2/3 large subunit
MTPHLSRRSLLKALAVTGVAAVSSSGTPVEAAPPGWVKGLKTGARALVEALQAEGTTCVFGIPGAQGNELWDEFKSRCLPYLLVTNEFSAACMADGAARATGRPGVLCIVPGPGITNALTGIGEALLDSVPLVVIAGDVARGEKYRAFQVHELANAALLKPVTKAVIEVCHVSQIPTAVRQAFQLALAGEPGPVAVVVPYNLLIESHKFDSGPLAPAGLPFDEAAFQQAIALLSNRKLRVGIFAGWGCMDFSADLARVAEMLQAPVATSVAGKGAISDAHPLAVGFGYGPQGTHAAEQAFKHVDLVLAIGVRFSEYATAFYSLPQHKYLIHVDASECNLGKVMKTTVCIHADAGVFLAKLLVHADEVCRPANGELTVNIRKWRDADAAEHARVYAKCGVDPVAFLLALRRATCEDGLLFQDVTVVEHWADEAYSVLQPRTYFNPTDNQSMGWSIPAALGAQRVMPGRQVVTVTGDGCMMMSAMELSTAARECLPVKFFILDDQVYHYMQMLQQQAYKRTTATVLARLDYPSLARGLGIAHVAIDSGDDLEAKLRGILALGGPALVTVKVDSGKRPCTWINAVRGRYTRELSTQQKVRFLGRLGVRSLHVHREND